MADDLNEAARAASRAGDHALAARLFERSWAETRDPHSAVNALYERYLLGEVTAAEVIAAVYEHDLQDGGHGRWLLEQVGARPSA